MQLAKPHLDVGLYTADAGAMLAFWQTQVGLAFEEMQPLGQGVRQHRHAMNGSVLKLNSSRHELPSAPPSGYRELWIARPGLSASRTLRDSDGNLIRLVPPGERDVTTIGLLLGVRELDAAHHFYGDVLQLTAAGRDAYRCGESLLVLTHDPNAIQATDTPMRAKGFRYVTIQLKDIDRDHAQLVARGATEVMAPITLGVTARISFVRDPDGNFIELSQRASLTGPLPGTQP